MAIRSYVKNGVRYYEAYVNGFDSNGRRIQRKRRGIETPKKAETIEFELKSELAIRKEQPVSYRFGEWFDECMRRMRLEFMPSAMTRRSRVVPISDDLLSFLSGRFGIRDDIVELMVSVVFQYEEVARPIEL